MSNILITTSLLSDLIEMWVEDIDKNTNEAYELAEFFEETGPVEVTGYDFFKDIIICDSMKEALHDYGYETEDDLNDDYCVFHMSTGRIALID